MAAVQVTRIDVVDAVGPEVSLNVSIVIKADSELEAIGWLVSKLEEE